jgi:TctA family transporter
MGRNLVLLALNLPLIGIWIRMLTIPYRLLFPSIAVFIAIGAYSLNSDSSTWSSQSCSAF